MTLSYNVDELFRVLHDEDGYYIAKYFGADDPSITEIEIPAEYNGEPITSMYGFADSIYIKRVIIPPSIRVIESTSFLRCENLETVELSEGLEKIRYYAFEETGLKSIVFPKSLKQISDRAFAYCKELESVTFNSEPSLGGIAFFGCFKLPADVALMELVHSFDIDQPFDANEFYKAFDLKAPITPKHEAYLNYIRPEVFRLAAKNKCFRNVDISVMLKFLVKIGNAETLRLAEECGLLDNRELVDKWIEDSVRQGTTEFTAYLLDLKRRKFGFNGGGDFEL